MSKIDKDLTNSVVVSKQDSITKETPKTGGKLFLHYASLTIQKTISLFKAICQLVVIFYQFLCLLYQYPNCMDYAIEVSYHSLLLCYQNGLWDPFKRVPTEREAVTLAKARKAGDPKKPSAPISNVAKSESSVIPSSNTKTS